MPRQTAEEFDADLWLSRRDTRIAKIAARDAEIAEEARREPETTPELQAEIGRLESKLARKVLGRSETAGVHAGPPMTAPTRPSAEDPMVIEVLSELCHLTGKNFDPEDTSGLIAAVLDGLPRVIMQQAVRRTLNSLDGDSPSIIVENIIVAARRSVLGHE